LGYGERECSKVIEAEDSSSKELRSSPTPSKKNDGTSLSKNDISITRYWRKSKSPRKSWDSKSVAKYWKRKAPYNEVKKDMNSCNYCTHFQMSGH
jgi:hypothetical protein